MMRRNTKCGDLVILRVLFALFLLPLLPTTAFAATLPPVGQLVSGSFELLGKPIPLPPGEWQVAASGFGQVEGGDPGPYGAIGGVLLVRRESDRGEFLLLHTNALPVREGWGQPAECADEHTLFQSVGEQRNLHNACSFVVALRRSQLLRSQLPALGTTDDAVNLYAKLPSWALITGFRVSDRRDMVDVRYGISPRRPDPEAWFVGEPPQDYAHRIIITQLGEWAQTARKSGIAALRDPAQQVPPMPAITLKLRDADQEVPQEQISAIRLALYKLATYRLPATAFTLAVSSIAAGNIYTGAVISFWQMFTHSGVYLGNELAWEWPTPTKVMPLVRTPSAAPAGTARRDAPPDQSDAPIRLAANSNVMPESAITLHRVITLDGKQIPLPEGRWSMLGSEVNAGTTAAVLGQIEDASLRGLLVVHTNREKTNAIVGPSGECGRSDLLFAVTRYDTPEDGFCGYGKRVMPMAPDERAMHDNPLWAHAAQLLADNRISIPPHLVMIGARARTQENYIDARYYFAVPAEASASPAALQNWADLIQEPLELGVRGRALPKAWSYPLPWDDGAVQAGTAAQTHEPLEGLAATGALTPAVLQQQVAAADAAMADREQQRLSLWSRSFLKVATYRVAAYVDTFAVQTFFTASPGQGVAVASVHAIAKPLMAYGNELYWAHSGLGKAPAALLSTNFPEIGTDR